VRFSGASRASWASTARQVRSLGKECRFRRKKMNPAPGLKIEILQDSSFWKTAIDRHSLRGCRLQHRYNPVARLG
jgi:hypothetical protein